MLGVYFVYKRCSHAQCSTVFAFLLYDNRSSSVSLKKTKITTVVVSSSLVRLEMEAHIECIAFWDTLSHAVCSVVYYAVYP